MPVDLITDRLELRPPVEQDAEGFVLLCADVQVMRHIGTGRPLDRSTAERGFALLLEHWGRHGYGLRSAFERTTGDYLGFVGLNVVAARSIAAGEPEIGWRLRRTAWGRGLATEGALAVRDEAFGPLGLGTLVSLVQPANHRSLRVTAKLGMREDGVGPGPRGERVLVLRVDRADLDGRPRGG